MSGPYPGVWWAVELKEGTRPGEEERLVRRRGGGYI